MQRRALFVRHGVTRFFSLVNSSLSSNAAACCPCKSRRYVYVHMDPTKGTMGPLRSITSVSTRRGLFTLQRQDARVRTRCMRDNLCRSIWPCVCSLYTCNWLGERKNNSNAACVCRGLRVVVWETNCECYCRDARKPTANIAAGYYSFLKVK